MKKKKQKKYVKPGKKGKRVRIHAARSRFNDFLNEGVYLAEDDDGG